MLFCRVLVVDKYDILKIMFKNFLLKKMLKSQGVPEAQIDMVLAVMEKDPELFKKIAAEIEAETKKGKSQQDAAMFIMPKYQSQLQKLMAQK